MNLIPACLTRLWLPTFYFTSHFFYVLKLFSYFSSSKFNKFGHGLFVTKGIEVIYTKYLRESSWDSFFPQNQWNLCVCVTYVLYLSIYLLAIYIHGTITRTIIQTGIICKKFLYKSLLNSVCFWSRTRHGIHKDKNYFLFLDQQANSIFIFEFYERTKKI